MASPLDFLLGKQPTESAQPKKTAVVVAEPEAPTASEDESNPEEKTPPPHLYGGIMADGASEFNSAIEAMCTGFVPRQPK